MKGKLISKCCGAEITAECADEGTCCYICNSCGKPCGWVEEAQDKRCILCGGKSPNVFGECLCSYEPLMFSGDYKRIAEKLADIIKNFWRLK